MPLMTQKKTKKEVVAVSVYTVVIGGNAKILTGNKSLE